MNKKVIIILILLNILVKGVLLLYPIDSFEGKTTVDDTYYSLLIAKNIADGKGPLSGENFTNGFQPLYVFLSVPIYWITSDLDFGLKLALALLMIFDCLSLFFLLKIIRNSTHSDFPQYLTGFLWIFNYYIISTSLNGLETMIAFFFLLMTYYYYLKVQKEKRSLRNYLILGMFSGFALFSRVDSGLFLFFIYSSILWSKFLKRSDENHSKKSNFKHIVYSILTAIIIYLPWLIYSNYYTGDLYQISGKAVRIMALEGIEGNFIGFYLNMSKRFIIDFIFNNYIELSMAFLFLLILIIKERKIPKINHKILLVFSLVLISVYVLYLPAYWYFGRYLFPIVLPLLLLAAEFGNKVYKMFNFNKAIYISFLIIVTLFISKSKTRELYFNFDTVKSYRYLALHLNQELPEGKTIGASQSGALGYFCQKNKIINLDGVVNKECYESIRDLKNMDYIKKKNIEYIIGWEDNINFIKNKSLNFKDDELIFVKKLENYQFWNQDWYIYKVKY
jgi:hypothetical protein